MAVLMLSVLAPLLDQLRLTEPEFIAMADDPETVAGLIRRQRSLDHLQLRIGAIRAASPTRDISVLLRRELRQGRRQDVALRHYLVAPISNPAVIVGRMVVLVATLEPDLATAALRTIIMTIGLPPPKK